MIGINEYHEANLSTMRVREESAARRTGTELSGWARRAELRAVGATATPSKKHEHTRETLATDYAKWIAAGNEPEVLPPYKIDPDHLKDEPASLDWDDL